MFESLFGSSQSRHEAAQKDARRTVADFVKKSPRSMYTFDSERDAPVAELCRHVGDGQPTCIDVHMASKALFQQMQDLGFFCALPLDPGKTHMECSPIPK
ncbi:hypothetical protein M407DRAFT_243840 [Tulasnella calospora MUT 4182]|uniref:Uncharacterized protein n=1 Tax=Tulasnella calospora MUT 4182 TaxID=1051891 RepID=A0A0C3KXJ3_9AGAM|nr:hypothetical protein M407DRAFT_243840 [Tulasnella calospora MUT 4182]